MVPYIVAAGFAMSHARVAPSALHLTVPCPRSLTLQESVPPCPDTEDELEGRVGHFVAEKTASRSRTFTAGEKITYAGRVWEVDQDMIDGAELYAEEAQYHSTARYEDAVSIPDVHPDCWGTPDYDRYMPEANLLKDVDYKYGHRGVEEYFNPQGASYLSGRARQLQLPDTVRAKFTIVQPRYFQAPAVREWETTVGRIRQFVGDVIRPAVAEALGPNPQAHTGPHCRDCKARHVCSLLQQNAGSIVDLAGSAEPAGTTSLAAMGAEARILKDAIDRLKARFSGLEAVIESAARGGANVPYWQMKPGHANLKWDVPVADVLELGRMMKIDLSKPTQVVTPTQAKTLGLDEAVRNAYASRPTPALHLKPDDTNAVRKVFNR